MFKRLWKRFVNAGINEHTPPELALRIRASNVLTLYLFATTAGYINNTDAGWAVLGTFGLLATYIVAYLMTMRGRHIWGRTLTMLAGGSLGVIPLLVYVQPAPQEFVDYYRVSLTAWIVFPSLLFTARETVARVLVTAPIIVLLFAFERIDAALQWIDNPVPIRELEKVIEPTKLIILLLAVAITAFVTPYIQKQDLTIISDLYDKEREKSLRMA
ncbi:MAG: hypothetical protein RMM53_04995, partial [Bacteroidia bacterium]|nr:hypothetical protein [Bacteroidia bacterium]